MNAPRWASESIASTNGANRNPTVADDDIGVTLRGGKVAVFEESLHDWRRDPGGRARSFHVIGLQLDRVCKDCRVANQLRLVPGQVDLRHLCDLNRRIVTTELVEVIVPTRECGDRRVNFGPAYFETGGVEPWG